MMMKKTILLLAFVALSVVNLAIALYTQDIAKTLVYSKNIGSDLVFLKNKDLGNYDKVVYKKPTMYDREIAAHERKLDKDLVRTKGMAAQMAEAVWYSQKGIDYYDYVLSSATLVGKRYWVVKASIPNSSAVLYVEIDKYDGHIIRSLEQKVNLKSVKRKAEDSYIISFKTPFDNSFVSTKDCDILYENK